VLFRIDLSLDSSLTANQQGKYTLEKEIRLAKRTFSENLRIQFSSSDTASVWKGLKDITNCKTPSPSTVENQQQADNQNEFYCSFEKKHHSHLLQPPSPPHLQFISVKMTCARYSERKNEIRKAPGPDSGTPDCLRTCTDKLAPIFTQITGAVRYPLMLQMLHHHPRPKETSNYWT